MKHNKLQQILVTVISAGLVSLGMPGAAHAGMIGTAELLDAEARNAKVEQVQEFLGRDAVRAQLEALGVDAGQAAERVAALTDAELEQLSQRLDDLPAGAGAAELVILVLLVLIVLELLGAINIFSKI